MKFMVSNWVKKLTEAVPSAVVTALALIGLGSALNFFNADVTVTGDSNNIEVVAPRMGTGDICPKDWVETKGVEPDTRKSFISCSPADRHYMLTIYQTEEGLKTLGYNLWDGRQLTQDEINKLY